MICTSSSSPLPTPASAPSCSSPSPPPGCLPPLSRVMPSCHCHPRSCQIPLISDHFISSHLISSLTSLPDKFDLRGHTACMYGRPTFLPHLRSPPPPAFCSALPCPPCLALPQPSFALPSLAQPYFASALPDSLNGNPTK